MLVSQTSHSRLDAPIQTEEELDARLSAPPAYVCDALAGLTGDIVLLGVAGKMGPTLARMAVRALAEIESPAKVYGVARFSQPRLQSQLEGWGVHTISCDLLDRSAMAALPESNNVIFMAGQKFGTTHDTSMTWAINTHMPALVADRYRNARIVVFSTGNVYPLSPIYGGGSCEEDEPTPIGEYAMSCLGRERIFEHFSRVYDLRCAIVRLNYATELRYGVLVDIARKVWASEPIALEMAAFNAIWQADANAQVLALLNHCATPAFVLNVTGPEIISVRWAAQQFGRLLDKEPILAGQEDNHALISNAALAQGLFGYPTVSLWQMMNWIAEWVRNGGRSLNKPTHFEARDGRY